MSIKNHKKQILIFTIIFLLNIIFTQSVYSSQITLKQVVNSTTKLYENKSINELGDWETFILNVIGNKKVPVTYEKSLNRELKAMLKDKKSPTSDYERMALLLISYKKNGIAKKELPYILDKIKNTQLKSGKFADYIDKTGKDLINTHILGIITLTVANIKFNRSAAIKWLNSVQNKDGGFSFSVPYSTSDTDITALSAIAYSKLGMNNKNIQVSKALKFLKLHQLKNGGFESTTSGEVETCETDACVINALLSLKISPYSTQWRVGKNNCVNAILKFYNKNGEFKHTNDSDQGNSISTVQALIAIYSLNKGKSIYNQIQMK